MRMLLRLAFFGAISWSAGCSKPRAARPAAAAVVSANTMNPGDFITKLGSLSYNVGKLSVDLDLSRKGDRIDWNFRHLKSGAGGRTYGSGMALASPDNTTWFLYMEDEETFWMYDGGSVLRYCSMEDSGPKSGTAIRDGKLESSALRPPDEVIARLSPELQKLYPPVKSPAERPSI